MKNTTKHLYLVAILTLLTANLYFQYEQTEKTKLLKAIDTGIYEVQREIQSDRTEREILKKLDSIDIGINEVQRVIPSDYTEGKILDLLKELVIILDR